MGCWNEQRQKDRTKARRDDGMNRERLINELEIEERRRRVIVGRAFRYRIFMRLFLFR